MKRGYKSLDLWLLIFFYSLFKKVKICNNIILSIFFSVYLFFKEIFCYFFYVDLNSKTLKIYFFFSFSFFCHLRFKNFLNKLKTTFSQKFLEAINCCLKFDFQCLLTTFEARKKHLIKKKFYLSDVNKLLSLFLS